MLESYIAPLFTGYVDKYIKNLKPSDLSLSLWGGDVVLQNLELNLDVLQKELNLPITFLSGKIHKFQLHVPWTRLIYEPVVITIDTMEFIVKLKDVSEEETVDTPDENTQQESDESHTSVDAMNTSTQEQMPPGYVQGILNKVINNVSFKINNIIIKYVEDDIVFSLNVKSVDFHCGDKDWNRSFIELNLPDLILRKICDITDVTICLDHRNTSGKIELYQDPLLYKCNLSCRISSRYRGLSSTKPVENKIDVFCESCDFSLTDLQIPMVMRLLKLVIGLFYGTLDLPGCNLRNHTAPAIIKKHKNESSTNLATSLNTSTNIDDSWTSWAWSMIPGASINKEDEETIFKEDIKFCFGFYIANTTITLKSTNQSAEIFASQRLEFLSILCMEFTGCILEFVSIGDLFIDVNVGINSILGYMIGSGCVCNINQRSLDDTVDEIEDEVFLKIGTKFTENNKLGFLKRSLFIDLVSEAQNIQDDGQKGVETEVIASDLKDGFPDENSDKEKLHNVFIKDIVSGSKLSDETILLNYGTVFFNYYYEMTLPDLTAGDIENIFLYPETDEVVPEISEKKVFLSSCQVYISTTLIHSLQWIADICATKLSPRKEKEGTFLDPFVIQQLQLGNFLSRKSSVSLVNSAAFLFSCDHKKGTHSPQNSFQEEKEAISVQVDHCSLVHVSPMYPLELSKLLKDGKLVKLNQMKNLNSKISVEVAGLHSGLSLVNQETFNTFTLNILQPSDFNASTNSTLLPENTEISMPVINSDHHFECSDMSLLFTKLHLVLCYNILQTWMTEGRNIEIIEALVQSVFHPGGGSGPLVPLMNLEISGCNFEVVDMNELYALETSIQKINISLQSVGASGNVESTQLFLIPCRTDGLSDIKAWEGLDDSKLDQLAVELTVQFQKTKSSALQIFLLEIAGSALNVDVILHHWICQKPSTNRPQSQQKRTIQKQTSRLGSLSSIATPKRTKSYARIFGSTASPSQHSLEKEKGSTPVGNTTSNERPTHREPFGEWLAQKINLFKTFHVKVNIGTFILIFPDKHWPKEHSLSGNLLSMVSSVYMAQRKDYPSSLVVCCPKLNACSAQTKSQLFDQPIPILNDKTHLRRFDTLPWTITSCDFAVLTLFPTKEEANHDKKVETVYMCKPLSWKIYLAAAPSNSSVTRNVNQLGKISEQNAVTIELSKPYHIPLSKSQGTAKLKHTIGFVIHADCSICECFVSQNQFKLCLNIGKNFHHSIESVMTSTITPASKSQHHEVKKETTSGDVLSQSSRSTVDLPDNFSSLSLTGSTNLPSKTSSHREVDVSLWIQCTLPKIKLSVLSSAKQAGTYYQVTNEIDEIMFAFDYQDNTLELTNKISSCIVYYSLLRFDTDPMGWVVMKHGFLFCRQDKHDSSPVDSKTLLTLRYQRMKQLTPGNVTLSSSNVGEKGDLETTHTNTSSVLSVEEEMVVKHEVNVSVQSFDVICIANPLLSSISMFTGSLKNSFTFEPSNKRMDDLKGGAKNTETSTTTSTFVTWPVVSVRFNSVRLIMPHTKVGNAKESLFDEERLMLFHLHSIELSSSPVNPITKTVVDKDAYQRLKHCYREPLRKLKLWNVQYQMDITNIGLCTTTWKSVQATLPEQKTILGESDSAQNPALEWNSDSAPEQPKMTPIFMGFDVKITIAPPVMLNVNNISLQSVTTTAVEFHSPRPIKLYINSSQIALSMQIMEEVKSLLKESSVLFDLDHASTGDLRNSKTRDNVFKDPAHNDSGINTVSEIRMNNGIVKSTKDNSNMIPPIELFGSISSISAIFYHRQRKQSAPLIFPILYVNLTQPTCSFNTIKSASFQFTLLDLTVSTSSSAGLETEISIPPLQTYDVVVLSCGKGQVNEKFGFSPTLINFSLSMPSPKNVVVNAMVAKSVFVKVNLPFIEKVSLFLEALSILHQNETVEESTKKDEIASEEVHGNLTEAKGSGVGVIQSESIKLSSVHFQTNQFKVSFSMSRSLSDETCVVLSYYNLDSLVTLTYNKQTHQPTCCSLITDFVGMQVGLTTQGKQHMLVLPSNITTKINAYLTSHSGNLGNSSFPPKLNSWVDFGVMEICISQRLYEMAKLMVEEVSQVLKSLQSNHQNPNAKQQQSQLQQQQTEGEKDQIHCEENPPTSISIDLKKTVDDLRSGMFTYYLLKDDSEDIHPEANQIVFSREDDHTTPVMSWCYTEPRIVTELFVMPVPFYMPNEYKDVCDFSLTKVQCHLQYWDNMKEDYTTYHKFHISENDTSYLCLVDEKKLVHDAFCLSQYWRVVVATEQNTKKLNLPKTTESDSCPISPITSPSLAACLKINSLSCTYLVPSVQCHVTASTIQIRFHNTIHGMSDDLVKRFEGFYMDEKLSPESSETLRLSLSDIDASFSLCPTVKTSMRIKTSVDVDVMDFRDLCWIDFLTQTDFQCDLNQLNAVTISSDHQVDPETCVNLAFDEIDVLVTQTAVHTLFLTSKSWMRQIQHGGNDGTLFNHFILCNNTQESFHIQQVNTDEDIILHSTQLYAYSWCARRDRQLRLCIERTCDWKWSEGFDVTSEGFTTLQLEHKGFSSLVIVEVKLIGGVQRQVVFHGCCALKNHLCVDIELEMVTQETDHSIQHFHHNIVDVSRKFLLSSRKTVPSITISYKFIKTLKLRGVSSEQQAAVLQFPNGEEETTCYASVQVDNRLLHVCISWRPDHEIRGQMTLHICPLFILRNHLSEAAILNVTARDDENEKVEFIMEGKGKETQVFDLQPKKWFNFSFALPGSDNLSKPPLAANTSMSSLLQENECFSNDDLRADVWPYHRIHEQDLPRPSKSHKVSYAAETEPKSPRPRTIKNSSSLEAELNFQASLKWSLLPTVLIDLKPTLLICNMSRVELLVKGVDTSCLYKVSPQQSISPFYVKELLSIGLNVGSNQLWSQPIRLGMRTSNFHDVNTLEECVKIGTSVQVSLFDDVACHQFSFKFNRCDTMYVVTIRERFVLHNLSSICLLATPLMFKEMKSSKVLFQMATTRVDYAEELPFSCLNVLKSTDGKIEKNEMTGLAIHFQMNEKNSSQNKDVLLMDLMIKIRDCLILSEDHLREVIVLQDEKQQTRPFVLTSIMEDGVIHVFIKEDKQNVLQFENKTNIHFVVKDISDFNASKTHYNVLESNKDNLQSVRAKQVTHVYPSRFKTTFPKGNNPLQITCQFGASTEDTTELSKPITLCGDTDVKLFVPVVGEIRFCSVVQSGQLFIEILESTTSNISVIKRPLPIPEIRFTVSSLDVILVDSNMCNDDIEGILSLSISSLSCSHKIKESRSNVVFSMGGLQLDNQLKDACYHFPVIFLPMRGLSQRYHTVSSDAPFPDLEASSEIDFCSVSIKLYNDFNANTITDSINVKLQPCEMYLEDVFVYRISKSLGGYVPVWTKKADLQDKSKDLLESILPILNPIRICSIHIDDASVLLSVHASLKMFLAADHIPLRFGRFQCEPTQTVSEEFMRMLLYHYATQVLVRVGWIVGSLEIIGNPTGLIHSVGRGLSDFFVMPYQGLTRGPTAFVSGISHGITSFLRHVSTGTLTSISNVSSSISRNLDRLSFDETHLLLQEQRRTQVPMRTGAGLQNAFGSLGLSLLGAVAGLVDHSIQNIIAANSTKEAVTGVVTGFAKGMVGVVAKPIGGAMEFVSQTSQGILQGTGLVKVPERNSLLVFRSVDDLGREETYTKFIWQYLQLENSFDIFIVACILLPRQCPDDSKEKVEQENTSDTGALLLTHTALFLFKNKESIITSAFPFKEIEITTSHIDEQYTSLKIFKRLEVTQSTNRMSLDENPTFRQFFESFQEASVSCEAERLYSKIAMTKDQLILEVKIPLTYTSLFMTRYQAYRKYMQDSILNHESLNL